jgi:hypothetical protein
MARDLGSSPFSVTGLKACAIACYRMLAKKEKMRQGMSKPLVVKIQPIEKRNTYREVWGM